MATEPVDLRKYPAFVHLAQGAQQLFLRIAEATEIFYPVNRRTRTVSASATLDDTYHKCLLVVDTAAVDLTVPATLRSDFECEILYTAASGDVTLVEGSGVTINPTTGGSLDISTRYAKGVLEKISSVVFNLSGTLDAP